MHKQGAGQSETLQSLYLYCVSLPSFFSVHTANHLLACFLVLVGGLRSGNIPENLPLGSGSITGLMGMASGEVAPLYF